MNKTIYKIMIPLVALVLSAILLTVFLCGQFGKTETQKHTAEVTDGAGNEILTDGIAQAMPERMIFGARALSAISSVSETSTQVTLTATINPLNADNRAVDWSVAWKNAASEWASGKNVSDYMTVTPASDGALTATVNCKKPFGEQIKITVASRDNQAATAHCDCDYVKRVTEIQAELKEGTTATETVKLGVDQLYTVGYTPVYGEGTVSPTIQLEGCSMVMTDDFLSTVQAYNHYLPSTVTAGTVDASSFTANNAFLYELGGNHEAIKTSLSSLYIGGVRDAIHKMSADHAVITVTVSVHYGDILNHTVTKTLPVKFDDEAMVVHVQSVEIDHSTLTI